MQAKRRILSSNRRFFAYITTGGIISVFIGVSAGDSLRSCE